MSQANKPKVLLWDIESSFNVGAFFEPYQDQRIPHRNILKERHIICISYRWLGERKIHTISILDDPARFNLSTDDDYHVVSEFHKVLMEADAVIYHHGDVFDMRMFMGRVLFHRLPPLPKLITYDTKKIASKLFRLNSNRLDYLGQYLGVGKKIDTPSDLWLRCLKGEKKAIREMITYNKGDVDLLDKVYNILKDYAEPKWNMQFWSKPGSVVCPHCGSSKITWEGYRIAPSGTKRYRRYKCEHGHWSQAVLSDKTANKVLLK